jgi:protocatechuate 3,4-dioxygenase beta subunit
MSKSSRIGRRRALQGIGAGVLVGATGLGIGTKLLATGSPAAAANWATTGTKAMLKAASYPDPFVVADQACSVTCEQILGPCYAPTAPLRQDISEGEPGIPMRLAFRLIDADSCAPLEGAEVEIWHTSRDGYYSAEDVEAGDFCTSGNERATASYFFRGRAIADPDGRIDFDSCFPGWYGGRAIHIHLLVRLPEHAGEANTRNLQTVTQLYFPDELIREVFDGVEGYAERGQPDMSNSRDSVLRRADSTEGFTFGVERMEDGAMIAWKTISVSAGEQCGSRGFRGFRR